MKTKIFYAAFVMMAMLLSFTACSKDGDSQKDSELTYSVTSFSYTTNCASLSEAQRTQAATDLRADLDKACTSNKGKSTSDAKSSFRKVIDTYTLDYVPYKYEITITASDGTILVFSERLGM